jgi:hydantoinase/carbamoylase family amidase
MSISQDRIRADIEAIAKFAATPGSGASRPTFSPHWRQARDYVIEQAKLAGCQIRLDAFGNVHARPKSLAWDAPVWLCGSHIDSVPNGGDYDGVAGVVVPLEILRADASANLELIIFAEEEGTTFGSGMMGSRAWVDADGEKVLTTLKNAQGLTYVEAGKDCGVDPARFAADRLNPARYLGLIEVHIEQGPGMWKRDERIAIVRAIAGRKQYRCTFRGIANHAGSTSMSDRQDALLGAAAIILQCEDLARGLSTETVMTVGRINCKPNAVNVIPNEVEFTIDFRAPDNETLADGHARLEAQIKNVAHKRGLKSELTQTENQSAVAMDEQVVNALSRAAEARLKNRAPLTISGALHDSAILAPHIPTAMLFVPSRDGISHNPAEFSRIEDIALAAEIVLDSVK